MPSELWPPKVYHISTGLLNDESISHPVFRFYCKLRALAWGKSELRMPWNDFMTAVNLQRSAVYEYARSLELHGDLLFRRAADVFECSFTEIECESASPLLAEFPIIKESVSKESRSSKANQALKIRKSGNPLEAELKSKATVRQITDAYIALLDYDPGDWAAGEGKAAKEIAQRYTVEEFTEAYKYFKAQKFWADKRLTLRHLKTQIGDYFAGKKNGRLNNANTQERRPGHPSGNGVSAAGAEAARRLAGK